jgi:hypothetical protein
MKTLDIFSHHTNERLSRFIKMSYNIRPATTADIPIIAKLDFAVNADRPIGAIPWAKLTDGANVFLDRYQFFFKQPQYHFLVASGEAGILGFLIWLEPGDFPEWKPDFPEGTNLKFFETILGPMAGEKTRLGLEGLIGMFRFNFLILGKCY